MRWTAELDARLMEASRRHWDPGKLIKSLEFSIVKGAKHWLDPDDDYADRKKEPSHKPKKLGPMPPPQETRPRKEIPA